MDVVTEVVCKRMEPVPKLALIQGLGIIPTCCQWASSPPYQEDQEDLGQRFARLLNALATGESSTYPLHIILAGLMRPH